ncbi:MAG: sodium-dependent transporter [Gammaproteobacteria bacterium]|nr:sodium-dependent transporter [Gammaproteobacteria bacterium]
MTQTACAADSDRGQWSSRFGFVLASVGGAIGLGNVWKFPYVTGQYGGASFLIVFLIALTFIALPVLMTEFAIGRNTQLNYTGALRKLLPGTKWHLVGIMGVIALIIILSFYFGIAGWTLAYFFKSISGSYAAQSQDLIAADFGGFLNSPATLVFWQFVMVAITAWVVIRGINNGIEKICRVLLPLLFFMILALAIRACTLPGAMAGIEFYLKPDWSKLNGEAVLAALGQAFFTLGVGCGNLVIYGSYLKRDKSIGSSAAMVAGGDTLAAVLMGFIIFPAAFAFGINPESAGPPLVFMTLPSVFAQMNQGMLFASAFYLCLFFACLTSTMCILEGIVGYVIDEWQWQRKKATLAVCTLVFVLGVFQMLSFGPLSDFKVFNKTIFELSDFFVSNLLLPLGGLMMTIFAGWWWKDRLVEEINIGEGLKIDSLYVWCVRILVPLAITGIFLQQLGLINL